MTKAAFIMGRDHLGGVCLVPVDDDGVAIVRALKPEKPCIAEVFTPRNPGHHRMLFAVFKLLTEAGAWDGDMDSLLDWMKYATGHVRTSIDHKGELHTIPKSIAFESMPQDVFKRWFDRVVYVVCERLLKSVDNWQAIRDQVLEIVEGDLQQRINEQRRS